VATDERREIQESTRPPRHRAARHGALAALGILLVLVLAAVGLRALAPGGAEASAWLVVDGRSKVEQGTLVVLLDEEEIYRRPLSARAVGPKVFRKRPLKVLQESFETRLEVPPGQHQVVARVVPQGETEGYERLALVDLDPGELLSLRLRIGRDAAESFTLSVARELEL
jgi:hypothetical protein